MKRYLLLLLIVCATLNMAVGQTTRPRSIGQIAGASLTYTKTATPNRYQLTLTYLNDCSSVEPLLPVERVTARSTSGLTETVNLTRSSLPPTPIGNICPARRNESYCNANGTLPDYRVTTFSGFITLPATGEWLFTWTNDARSDGVRAALGGGGDGNAFIEAFLDNTEGDDNSPNFNNFPIITVTPPPANRPPFGLDFSATDADGDRLVYRMVAPKDGSGNELAFANGGTVNNPLGGGSFLLNQRGLIGVNPTGAIGNRITTAVVEVSAFRDNKLVNRVRRDWVVEAPEINNVSPTILDAAGPGVFGGDTLVWCWPYQEQTYTIGTEDPQTDQQVTLKAPGNIQALLQGATITEVPGTRGSITINWQPTPSQTGVYRLTLTAEDDNCPTNGKSVRTFVLVVNPRIIIEPREVGTVCNSPATVVSFVRGGTPNYRYNWTAQGPGTITSSNTDKDIQVSGEGTYSLTVTDRFNCRSDRPGEYLVSKNFFGAFQVDNVFPPVTGPGPYTSCTTGPSTLTFRVLSPAGIILRNFVWTFSNDSETDNCTVGPTDVIPAISPNDGIGTVRYRWQKKGIYRVKVRYYNATNDCFLEDSTVVEVHRKPDLNIEYLDTCSGFEWNFVNRPASPIVGDTCWVRECSQKGIQSIIQIFNASNVRVFNSPTDIPPPLQPVPASCDTVRLGEQRNIGELAGPHLIDLRFRNECGDSVVQIRVNFNRKPTLWPDFTEYPYPPAQPPSPPTHLILQRTCPFTVYNPDVRGGRPPYTFKIEGNEQDYDIVADPDPRNVAGFKFLFYKPGIYRVIVTDDANCEFDKTLEILSPVELSDIFYSQDCNSREGGFIALIDAIRPNRINFPQVRRVVWDFGDGSRDTTDSFLGDRINAGTFRPRHSYANTGTYNVTLIIYSAFDSAGGVSRLGCWDTIVRPISVSDLQVSSRVLDSTLCFIDFDNNGLKIFDPLIVEGPNGPDVQRWELIGDIAFSENRSIKTRREDDDAFIRYNLYTRPGFYNAVLLTTFAGGCVRSDTFRIFVADEITSQVAEGSKCFEGQAITYTAAFTNPLDSNTIVDYFWDMGDGTTYRGPDKRVITHTFLGGQDRQIRLTVISEFGCTKLNEFLYRVPDFPVPSLRDTRRQFCVNSSVELAIDSAALPQLNRNFAVFRITGPVNSVDTIQDPRNFRDWKINKTFTVPGRYNLLITVVKEDESCFRSGETVFEIFDTPQVDFNINDVCQGEPLIFDARATRAGAPNDTLVTISYIIEGVSRFDTSALSRTHTTLVETPGLYNAKVILRSQAGCIDSLVKPVQVFPKPVARFRFEDATGAGEDVIAGRPVRFISQSTATGGSPITLYRWRFGDGDSTEGRQVEHTYPLANVYVVHHIIENEAGCSDTATDIVDLKAYFAFPKAFTPNDDKVNDVFTFRQRGVSGIKEFRVYNRWGEKVFDAGTNFNIGWDGTHNGRIQPNGVYIFRATGTTVYGTDITVDGQIALVR